MAAEICAGIERGHGLSVLAVLRTPRSCGPASRPIPFEDGARRSRALITYLSGAPSRCDVAKLEPDRFLPIGSTSSAASSTCSIRTAPAGRR